MSRCEIITRRTVLYLGLIVGFAVSGDIAAEGHAGGAASNEYGLDASEGSPGPVLSNEMTRPQPSESIQARPAREPIDAEQRGNPLWAIPLGVLSATRERPLFSSSRRSPARVVAAPPRPEPVAPPPPPAPEVLSLALVGAVVNGDQGIAVFVDPSTQTVIRLRLGEAHVGWVLRRIQARETTLEKDQRTVTLKLPLPGEPQPGLAIETARFGAGTGVLPGLAPVNPVVRAQLPAPTIPLAPTFAPGSIPSATGRLPGL